MMTGSSSLPPPPARAAAAAGLGLAASGAAAAAATGGAAAGGAGAAGAGGAPKCAARAGLTRTPVSILTRISSVTRTSIAASLATRAVFCARSLTSLDALVEIVQAAVTRACAAPDQPDVMRRKRQVTRRRQAASSSSSWTCDFDEDDDDDDDDADEQDDEKWEEAEEEGGQKEEQEEEQEQEEEEEEEEEEQEEDYYYERKGGSSAGSGRPAPVVLSEMGTFAVERCDALRTPNRSDSGSGSGSGSGGSTSYQPMQRGLDAYLPCAQQLTLPERGARLPVGVARLPVAPHGPHAAECSDAGDRVPLRLDQRAAAARARWLAERRRCEAGRAGGPAGGSATRKSAASLNPPARGSPGSVRGAARLKPERGSAGPTATWPVPAPSPRPSSRPMARPDSGTRPSSATRRRV